MISPITHYLIVVLLLLRCETAAEPDFGCDFTSSAGDIVAKRLQALSKPVAPVAQLVTPRNLLTRWDVSSNPGNWDFSSLKIKNTVRNTIPNKYTWWRTIKSLLHKIRLDGRRGKGTAESFPREN